MSVNSGEIDPGHDAYLNVIGRHSGAVGDSMHRMGVAAGRAGGSLGVADFATASDAMDRVRDGALEFLQDLAGTRCPEYLRGADSQIQDALKLLVDGAGRGMAAADRRDGLGLTAAGSEMTVAGTDLGNAGLRLADWRSGAARP